MNQLIDQIFTFNEQIIGLGDIEKNALTQKQYDWLRTFCLEELSELEEAFNAQDIVKMVDAVCDLIYGAMGTFKKMGLTREQVAACFSAVHAANMTKKRGDKGRGSDEDAVKPAEFVPPEQAIGLILFGGQV
jgi:predicted HAD superfamily Cof-like phosphohydrolase